MIILPRTYATVPIFHFHGSGKPRFLPKEYANSANEPNMNQNHPEKQILSSQTKAVNLGINQDLWEIL